jgi:hypothetical protein
MYQKKPADILKLFLGKIRGLVSELYYRDTYNIIS